MGLKMILYLANVTSAVILSQPSICIGSGLHAPSFRTALLRDSAPCSGPSCSGVKRFEKTLTLGEN